MTLDEAIKHAEEVADSHERIKQIKAVTLEECMCADEHRQLAEWLRELKAHKEHEPCEDAISRKAVNTLVDELAREISDERCYISRGRSPGEIMQDIIDLPSVTPEQKTGKWIEMAQYSDGMHKIACSECKTHIFDRGHANSIIVKNKYKYCPSCGAKMEVEE